MQVRSLGYRTDLMVRRLAGSQITEGDGHLVVRTPRNSSFFWGNFLLFPSAPAPGEIRRWLDLFAAEFPRADHVAFGVDGTEGPLKMTPELDDAGLTIDSGTVLTAQGLREPAQPPTDGTARPLRTAPDWEQAVELRVALGESEGSTSPEHRTFLESSVAEARHLVDLGHATVFGAFVDGRLCAYLGLVSDGGPVARYQSVETHPDYRRQGLASDLVYRAGLHGLEDRGARTLVMVADPVGPAIGLYRALGFSGEEQQAELLRAPTN
jgi:ribosomal protein S18 acetylase RimI-like enzyme